MIKLTGLWLNKDKNGNEYFSGTLGGSRVMIMKNTFKKGEREPDFNLFIAENKKKEEAPKASDKPAYDLPNVPFDDDTIPF